MNTKKPRHWLKTVLIALVVGVAALAVIGFVYQTLAIRLDNSKYPPPGQMVDKRNR
jgi:hypothetical protein